MPAPDPSAGPAPAAATALLTELAARGVKLSLLTDGKLKVSAPSGRLTADLRERIAQHKAALADWLTEVQDRDHGPPGGPRLVPRPAELFHPFAPSDLQMSYLVGSQEGFEYHVRPHQYMELDFPELDPVRFARALNEALRRQRASIVVLRDDLTLQTVRDPGPMRVGVTDLRHHAEGEVRDHIERVRARMQRSELPLDRWPWLAAEITWYDEGRARLHYNHNNFFVDGPGTGRFLDSALHCYRHPREPRPELELSYRDCLLALAELEESEPGRTSEKYWRERIPGLPRPPAIPLATGVGTQTRSRLSRRELVLPEPVWTRFKRQATSRGLTPTSAVYGAYCELLSCWSGSRHFLLSNMVTRRLPLHPQIGEVFGNFATLYPLEVDWRPDEPFADRVRRLHTQVMADLAHLYWGGAKVLQALNQEWRSPGQAACPFVIGSGLFMGHLDRPVFSTLETPQVLLDCQFWEQGDGSLWLVWDLMEAMFPAGLVDDMHQAFGDLLDLLASGAAAWQRPAFDLLPAAQREHRDRVNGSGEPGEPGLLHAGLARQAAAAPGRLAVISPGLTLGYGELHERSTCLAARLRERGVRPGDRVAVVLPKGWEQAVAVFAALIAGAAYVPLDPGWPAERLKYLLADTAAAAALTSINLRDGLAGLTAAPVLAVGGEIASRPGRTVLGTPPRPDDLAYVIYTSGSTGRPKGAMLSHRGPLATIADVNRRFGVGPDDVLFGASSLCFDLSVYDIFGAAEAGAALILPEPDAGPARWLELARAHRVTVWNSVPALMELLTTEAAAAGVRLPELRLVLLSGDWIPVGLPQRVLEIAPAARVVSLGGATEASIWSICYPVDRPDPGWASIPYGKPLAGQRWFVLDEVGRDAPTWVTGELFIGGTGVAIGYLNDPARTKVAFVTHPDTGERLYRTGDLGRYLPSGDIEFLGRADFQVKVQGFRVEPGEVEHALTGHPAVGQAVVVARPSGSGRQLAAFVTLADGASVSEASLRDFLASTLPRYLLPSYITVLDRLPLTANGKLDRRALTVVGPAGPGQRRYVAPSTPTQRALVPIWEEILAAGPVGAEDDFFELGGQSFAALRMTVLLAERLGRRVAPGVLLDRRTITALAGWLDAPARGWSPLVTLRRSGIGAPWFFVHPAGGNVLCYRGLAALSERPFHAFQAADPARDGRGATVGGMAAEYIRALRDVQAAGPYLLGGWSSGAVVAFEMASQLQRQGEAVDRLVVVDAPAPLTQRDPDEVAILLWFLEDVVPGFDAGGVPAAAIGELAAAAPSRRLERALALVREQGQDAGALDTSAAAVALAVFRRVTMACSGYQAQSYRTATTVVRAAEGQVSEFAQHPCAAADDWGWARLTGAGPEVVTVSGTHHTVLSEANVGAVADVLNGVTNEVDPARS